MAGAAAAVSVQRRTPRAGFVLVEELVFLVVVVLGAEIAAVEVAPGGLDLVVADVGAGARGGAGGGEGEPGLQRRRRGRD